MAHTTRGPYSRSNPSQELCVLHSFDEAAGKWPVGTLVEVNGLLYGTTQRGGQNNAGTPSQHDEGTLFRIDLLGLLFEHLRDLNGYPPAGLLKVGTDLYGTTSGYGSIFKFDTTRDQFEFVENVEVYGALYPAAALLRASNGLIYGTTEAAARTGTERFSSSTSRPIHRRSSSNTASFAT